MERGFYRSRELSEEERKEAIRDLRGKYKDKLSPTYAELKAQNAKLREALKEIANYEPNTDSQGNLCSEWYFEYGNLKARAITALKATESHGEPLK